MVEYTLAIKRPFSNIKDLLIGTLMYAIPILSIITGMFAGGYILRCAKSAIKGDFYLPEWDQWGDLFVKGLLSFVISLIYAIPFFIIIILVLGNGIFTVFGAAIESGTGPEEAFAALGMGFLLIMVCLLALFYILPIPLVRYAETGRFGDAFSLGKVFSTILTGKYLLTFVLLILYSIVLLTVTGLLNYLLEFTVVLPYIISAVSTFALSVTTMTALGELYGEGTNL